MAGIEPVIFRIGGSAPMMTDLIGGRIQFAFDGVATTVGYIRSGTVRSLGVSSAKRSAVASRRADDFRIRRPGFRCGRLVRLVCAGRHPQTRGRPVNSKVNAALAAAEVREGFPEARQRAGGGGPDVLAAKVQSELQKWTTIVREKNIRIEQ